MNEYFVKIYYVPAMYKALCWAQYKYGSLIQYLLGSHYNTH